MAQFTVGELRRATGGELRHGADTTPVFGVSTDSRKILPGSVFIALSGENFDGHTFAGAALEKGAAGVIAAQPLSIKLPDNAFVIQVEDTLQALQDIARYHRLRYAIPVIAVTGSNGKTTTKDMIAAVLAQKYVTLKTEANFNNEIGLPLTLLSLREEHQVAVVEMGMRGLGEIKELAKIAVPNMAVVTNVGETHMELLGSKENIALAKAELVEFLGEKGIAFLNGDDRLVKRMAERCKGEVVYYSTDSPAAVQATDIRLVAGDKTIVTVKAGEKQFPVTIPVPGRHNAINAMAAIAVALSLGMTESEIQQGLLNFVPSAMRLDIRLTHQGYKLLNDVYNASPLSMRSAVDTLNDIAAGRKIAVLGDMLELGDISTGAHLQVGKYVAEQGIDALFTLGEQGKYMAEGARQAARKPDYVVSFTTIEPLMEKLSAFVKAGDTILVKGSRGMRMERVSKGLEEVCTD